MSHKCCCCDGRLQEFTGEITREAILHGVKYLALPKQNIFERLFWGLVLLTGIGYSVFQVEKFFVRYLQDPVMTTFESKVTSISQIPFPAITLCNVNLMKWTTMWEEYANVSDAQNKYYYSYYKPNATESDRAQLWDLYYEVEKSALLLEYMTQVCLSSSSFWRRINETLYDASGREDFIMAVQNHLKAMAKSFPSVVLQPEESLKIEEKYADDIEKFLHEGAHDCDDMILKCTWANEMIPCEAVFHHIHTSSGICCSFNMMPEIVMLNLPYNSSEAIRERRHLHLTLDEILDWESLGGGNLVKPVTEEEDSRSHPIYQTSGGVENGLTLLLNPELNLYSTCSTNDGMGFKLQPHSPISFPNVMEYGIGIPHSSEVFINVEPVLTIANGELGNVDVQSRGCYFAGDEKAQLHNYKFYTATNCMSECVAKYTLENCSCVTPSMIRNASTRMCGAVEHDCAEDVRVNLAMDPRGRCLDCLPACTEIKYKTQMTHFPVRSSDVSSYFDASFNQLPTRLEFRALNYSIVHIYIGMDSVYAKERKKIYSPQDILAQVGGALGFTLGFSIISFVQLVYFCTLGAWFRIRSSPQTKVSNEEVENYYYSKSSKKKASPRLSAIVGSRLLESIRTGKMTGYYNWNNGNLNNNAPTKTIHVRPAISNRIEATSSSPHRPHPDFSLLAGSNSNYSKYP